MLPFSLVTALFFLWGVPNNLNDVLIRQFMKSFAISRFQAGLVQSAFYLGYFFLAAPAALIMRKAGYKTGILIGLLLFATGSFLFWPAAIVQKYAWFLTALFIIASGLSFLETASNPFIAQIGSSATAERRLNFSQAFNPIGSICGVFIGTTFIFSGIELEKAKVLALIHQNQYHTYLTFEIQRVVRPYLVLGAVALLLALMIVFTKFPSTAEEEHAAQQDPGSYRELLAYPHFLLAVFAQFMYVGAQVGTWSYFIQYVQAYTHQPEKIAGYLLTGTLAAFGVGRFASTWLMQRVQPARLMGVFSIINICLLAVGILHPGWLGLWAVFLTSFFMSLMYPTIFALGLRGLGINTKIGGSLIVMAIVGGAVLTPLMGLLSQSTQSLAIAYTIPLAGFCVTALYSFLWWKLPHRIPQKAA